MHCSLLFVCAPSFHCLPRPVKYAVSLAPSAVHCLSLFSILFLWCCLINNTMKQQSVCDVRQRVCVVSPQLQSRQHFWREVVMVVVEESLSITGFCTGAAFGVLLLTSFWRQAPNSFFLCHQKLLSISCIIIKLSANFGPWERQIVIYFCCLCFCCCLWPSFSSSFILSSNLNIFYITVITFLSSFLLHLLHLLPFQKKQNNSNYCTANLTKGKRNRIEKNEGVEASAQQFLQRSSHVLCQLKDGEWIIRGIFLPTTKEVEDVFFFNRSISWPANWR